MKSVGCRHTDLYDFAAGRSKRHAGLVFNRLCGHGVSNNNLEAVASTNEREVVVFVFFGDFSVLGSAKHSEEALVVVFGGRLVNV